MSTPATRGRRSINKAMRGQFLEHIAAGGTAREAARLTGRHHSTWYELAKQDEEFARVWKDAEESGTQVLEGEATRRAVDGYFVTRYDAEGKVLWREHRHDNTLLTNVLKSRAPERWRDNSRVEIAGAVDTGLDEALDRFTAQVENAVQHSQRLTLGDLAQFATEVKGLTDPPLALPPGSVAEVSA